MFKSSSFRSLLLLSALSGFVTGCAIAPGYTDSELEIKESLSSSKFQPASREMRDNIETQELFAQAAFWSREYELNPGDLESSIKLAAAVRKLGNAQRAVEIAQTARALYPRDPYLTAEFAAGLIASERAYEAMQPLDTALRSAPGYARLWSLKGAALDQQEEYDLARKHYAQAMKITPNDPNVMANIGLSFALSGEPQTAESWLRRAVSIPGASQSVRQNLSLILQLQGKEAEAQKYSPRPQLRGTTKVGQQALASPRPTPSKTNTVQPSQSYAQRSYPSHTAAPRQTSSIPASERSGQYSQNAKPATKVYSASQTPQRTFHTGASLAGAPSARKSTPLTTSDLARLAAQKSPNQKITVPLGQDINAPTAEQSSVLEQIAKTIGPQASHTVPNQSYQANVQSQARNFAYPQRQGQVLATNNTVASRAPARARR